MSLPVYKVEFWEPGAGAYLYQLTADVNSIYTKEILTDAIGYFTLQLLTKKDAATYYYNDIDINDTVKIWVGWDTVAADPTFIGRVGKISAPLSTQEGYLRMISGPSQGEILQRRFKTNKYWNAQDASQIVTDVATDLGILHAADIDADTNDITLEVATKTYFDILREISDYWIDASNKVQKDFWVDIDGHLHWKTRPVRTAGVETFTVASNILSYNVTQFVDPVKNNITVYGVAEKTNPTDKDSWTEGTTNWSSILGAMGTNGGDAQVGSWCVTVTAAAQVNVDATYTPATNVSAQFPKETRLFHAFVKLMTSAGVPTALDVRFIDSTGDYYWKRFTQLDIDRWVEWEFPIGPGSDFRVIGTPDWWDIDKITFYPGYSAVGNVEMRIDSLYFGKIRYSATVTDSATPQRDFEIVDERLKSDSDCTKRAQTLLLMNQNVPKQVEVMVKGNTNVLIGDRVPLTIPAENITAVNFDIVAVEHTFNNQGFNTKATMINSLNTRQLLEVNPLNAIANLKRVMRDLSSEIKRL